MLIIRDGAFAPFIVEIDENNFTLIKEVEIKSGKNVGKINKESGGYFNTLEGLVSSLVRKKLVHDSGTQHVTLLEFLSMYKKLTEEFKVIFKKAGLE